ncbi:gamma-glutamyltransferase family protein [Variovorax atrisoli]|nr:gamma-glutamyltransferase [Variovorax paradoxus]
MSAEPAHQPAAPASATSRRGMVTSPHPLASAAGLEVLADGGNAIEAAIAMAAVLCVVCPHFTGLGGDGFWLIAQPGAPVRGISGIGQAAAALPPLAGPVPLRGGASALTTAAAVDSWARAFDISARDWQGRQRWASLLSRAIEHAQEGFAVSASQRFWHEMRAAEAQHWHGFDAAFPAGLSQQQQPGLARTLSRLASQGPREFYEGEVAHRLAAGLQAAGSPLTLDDMRSTRAREVTPLAVPYRGGTLLSLPPPTQGFATLEAMGILGEQDFSGIAEGSAEHFHRMVEAIKLAFVDRDRFLADPDFAEVPVQRLLDAAYIRQQAARAQADARAMPWPQRFRQGDTVFFAAADASGRGAGVLQSIYYDWGSGVVAGDTGVLWHNRGAAFHHDASHPNGLRGGKRPFHTLNPVAFMRDGRPELLLGTQGADGQPQTLVALLTRLIDFGLDPAQALARPRFLLGRTFSDSRDSLKLEEDVGAQVMAALAARGHEIAPIAAHSPLAGLPGVIRFEADGSLAGAHDPRGDGVALGL